MLRQQMNSGRKKMFDAFYQAAKQQDRPAFSLALKSYQRLAGLGFFSIQDNGYNLFETFVLEKDDASLEFVLDCFYGTDLFPSANLDVTRAYAYAGCFKKVEERIQSMQHSEYLHSHIAYAIDGYASGGFDNDVENLLKDMKNGICYVNAAATGYARVGNKNKVDAFILRGADISQIIFRCALAGQIDLMMELIQQTTTSSRNICMNFATWGLSSGGYLDEPGMVWNLFNHIHDSQLRRCIASEAKKQGFNGYALGIMIWLLQGSQVVKNGNIDRDNYWNITSLALGLSLDHTKQVYEAVHKYIYQKIQQTIHDQHSPQKNAGWFESLVSFIIHQFIDLNSLTKLNKALALDAAEKRMQQRNLYFFAVKPEKPVTSTSINLHKRCPVLKCGKP